MRVAIIASPFIPVPPRKYGGTELFIAQLAEGLRRAGIDVVVYACGESSVNAEVRSIYEKSDWPIEGEIYGSTKDLNHTSWSLRDCWEEADVVHLNNAPGLAFARFPGPKFVYTVHHTHTPSLSEYYSNFQQVQYVTISKYQQDHEHMPKMKTIHHGVDLELFQLYPKKQEYLCVLGRIAPVKGIHIAIDVAKKLGIPLKIAGEIQPMFRDYYETVIKPHIDGRFIEYVGEVDLLAKNEVLGNAMAMLFPIQWDEPFGLVMIEAMATGTPVIAFPRGSVREVVADGISGHVCKSAEEMAHCVRRLQLKPQAVRAYVQQFFSVERMVREYAQLYAAVLEPEKLAIIADSEDQGAAA